jgi:Dolichyl-phosphate-mannose-protein mannosyltransferase
MTPAPPAGAMGQVSEGPALASRTRAAGVLAWAAILLCAAVAAGVRLQGIDGPGFEFQPVRQYHSAQIARDLYLESREGVPEWKRRIARRNADDAGIVGEPPLMELATAFAWRATGGEHLWIPRFLSVVFWFAGGVFLFLIARRISPVEAALCCVWFYLFLHFAIAASRSFQPDPMMVALLLAGVLAILRYRESPTRERFWVAGAVSACAVLAKPGVALFPIAGAFLALSMFDRGVRATLKDRRTYAFGLIAVLPSALFVLVGLLAGFLDGDTQGRFVPHLLGTGEYWEGWLDLEVQVAGVGPLALGLVGIVIARGATRALLLGLLAGYFVYGLAFTYHIHTHDYYSLPLVPIVALSLTPVIALVLERLESVTGRRLVLTGIAAGALIASGALAAREIHERVTNSPENYHNPVSVYEAIGEEVNHSGSTLFVDQDFGEALRYYGYLSGAYWPTSQEIHEEAKVRDNPPRSAAERLRRDYWPNRRNTAAPPEYFIVTKPSELDLQPDLRQLLARFAVKARTGAYVVYDLRSRSPWRRLGAS